MMLTTIATLIHVQYIAFPVQWIVVAPVLALAGLKSLSTPWGMLRSCSMYFRLDDCDKTGGRLLRSQ